MVITDSLQTPEKSYKLMTLFYHILTFGIVKSIIFLGEVYEKIPRPGG